MTRKKPYIIVGLYLCTLCLWMMISGCMNLKQPSYELSYYTLEYPSIQGLDLSPLPVVIKVGRFGVAPAYDTHRIVYRDAPFKRSTYAYQRWRTPPGDLVSQRLREDLIHAGLFTAVLTVDDPLPCDYILTGTVDEFLKWNEAGSSQAVLSLSITLVAPEAPTSEHRIQFHKSYRIEEPLRRDDPPGLADAMSAAMSQLSEKIIADLHHLIGCTG